MDIYEALKSGTSAEDLVKIFNKDLVAAQKKLKDEQEQKEKAEAAAYMKKMAKLNAELVDAREDLAEMISYYLDAFVAYATEGESTESKSATRIDAGHIEQLLIEVEKQMTNDMKTLIQLADLTKGDLFNAKNIKSNVGINAYTDFRKASDADIIKNFIKGLN